MDSVSPTLPTCVSVALVELSVLMASWQGSLETTPQREMVNVEEELERQDVVRPRKALLSLTQAGQQTPQ